LSYFQEIAQAFIERGVHVAWSTGPAEEGFDLPRGSVVLPTTGLVERARILASARLYIGNDSGITHLAAAVGCPTVAIFGPTDPTIWGPQGEKTTVVRGQPWPTPATVFAQVWPMRS